MIILDCNINLFTFDNCVFDLNQNLITAIEPTDYISITTGYDYNKDVDDEIVQEVPNILDSYFLTDEMRKYAVNVLTSILFGKILNQEFYIYSVVLVVMEKVFYRALQIWYLVIIHQK